MRITSENDIILANDHWLAVPRRESGEFAGPPQVVIALTARLAAEKYLNRSNVPPQTERVTVVRWRRGADCDYNVGPDLCPCCERPLG